MATILVAELVLQGISKVALSMIASPQDATSQNVRMVEQEVMKMSGIVQGLREEVANMRDSISQLTNSVEKQKTLNLRDKFLTSLKAVDPSLRPPLLNAAMMVYTALHETSVETIAIEVSRVIREDDEFSDDDDGDEDEGDPFAISTTTSKIFFTQYLSTDEIAKYFMDLEKTENLFSQVTHQTEDRMRIGLSAWAPEENHMKKLAEATGGLYQICQTLCDSIKDSRGVYASASSDGNVAKSSKIPLAENATVLTLT